MVYHEGREQGESELEFWNSRSIDLNKPIAKTEYKFQVPISKGKPSKIPFRARLPYSPAQSKLKISIGKFPWKEVSNLTDQFQEFSLPLKQLSEEVPILNYNFCEEVTEGAPTLIQIEDFSVSWFGINILHLAALPPFLI